MERRERLNQIIRMLQESPRSSLAIKGRFAGTSARTIERDLEQLALEGRIQPVSTDRSRNQVWQARESIPALEVKWMSGRAAAAIKLMQGCVSTLLPASFVDDLQPLFVKADHALRQAHNREYAEAVQGPFPGAGMHPLTPDLVQHVITLKQALQHGQAVSLRYREAGGERLLDRGHLLGLLLDGQAIHLLAAPAAGMAPLQIRLDALRDVTVHEAAARPASQPSLA